MIDRRRRLALPVLLAAMAVVAGLMGTSSAEDHRRMACEHLVNAFVVKAQSDRDLRRERPRVAVPSSIEAAVRDAEAEFAAATAAARRAAAKNARFDLFAERMSGLRWNAERREGDTLAVFKVCLDEVRSRSAEFRRLHHG